MLWRGSCAQTHQLYLSWCEQREMGVFLVRFWHKITGYAVYLSDLEFDFLGPRPTRNPTVEAQLLFSFFSSVFTFLN